MTGVGWGAIITLSIFVLSNLAALVYWSAKITTLLDVVQNELKELNTDLKSMRDLYVTKELFSGRIAVSDKEHAAMWREIDRTKVRLDERA